MHNGMISDFREIVSSISLHALRVPTGASWPKRKEMLSHVTEGFTAMIEGGTDSEHLAAIYMSLLCEPADFLGADKHYPATSMWKALKSAIQTVESIQRKRGKTPDNFLNICASMRSSSSGSQCTEDVPSGWRVPPRALLPHQQFTFNTAIWSLGICRCRRHLESKAICLLTCGHIWGYSRGRRCSKGSAWPSTKREARHTAGWW